MKNNTKFLTLIFIISLFFRSIRSDYPPLTWDEAALGYNAFSLSQTLKDEHGSFLPLVLKSFGDYKPALYAYLAAPFISILGLSELSVRLPSILLGSLTPVVLFLLVSLLYPKRQLLPYLCATLLAFNPYNIHFSRGAWETNILTFGLTLALYLYFLSLKSQKRLHLYLSSFAFGLCLYSYQTAKLIVPLLISIILLVSRPKIRQITPFFVILLLISLPIASGLLFNRDSNRLDVVSIFSYPQSPEETNLLNAETTQADLRLFHNRLAYFSRQIFFRYLNHFSSRFLVFEGDWQNPRHSAPYLGVLLYPSYFFLLIGIITALNQFKKIPGHRFFLLWLIASPLSSSLTRDTVHAVRSMYFSIPLIVFIGLGISHIHYLLPTFTKKIYLVLVCSLYVLSFSYYLEMYHHHLVKLHPADFTYGYKQAIEHLLSRSNKKTVYLSDFYGQPYIFYLFYSHYPPALYQPKSKLVVNGTDIGKVETIDNIIFRSPSYDHLKNLDSVLAIFSRDDILRQNIDKLPEFSTSFIPLSPINDLSTFYAYEK